VLITHDLGVVAEMAQRVVVMYAGRKVEEAPVAQLFAQPRHPYTLGLLKSIPRLDHALIAAPQRLAEIPGMVPSLRAEPVGCTFAPRCTYATELCRAEYPPLELKAEAHLAACWHSDRVSGDAEVRPSIPAAAKDERSALSADGFESSPE